MKPITHHHSTLSHPMERHHPTKPPLRLLFWETTAGCNLECIHCRRLEVSHQLTQSDLTTEEGLAFIDSVAQTQKPILVLSGGEPLVRPDIFDLAAYAVKRGLTVALATNGTLVTPAIAVKIKEVGIERVSISIDGANAETHDDFRQLSGSYNRALEGVAHLRRAGVGIQQIGKIV